MSTKIVIATDPMCSWCWGMAPSIDAARSQIDSVPFDLVFGGINLHSTQPLGRYGRMRLARLWAEVAEVTQQSLAAAPPAEAFVYNSARLCRVLEAVRELDDAPPFELLRGMQKTFFADARNVTAEGVLAECIADVGHDADRVMALALDRAIGERVAAGAQAARSYGTHALPSVLLEHEGQTRLLAGGYLDPPTMMSTIRTAIADDDY